MRPRPLLRQTSLRNQRLTKHKVALCTWAALLLVFEAAAQTVYRCGDQYSASPSCDGAIIPSVEDARNARQAQTQKTQTLQAQQEADALERSRFKAEQQGQRNVAVVPMSNRDALFSNSAVESAAPATPPHGKHKKLASPYFTAKDNTPKPAKPPKQKAEKKGASPKAAP